VVNLLYAVEREIDITRRDTLLAVTSIMFDIAALELLLPLISGATVVIAPREATSDATQLLNILRTKRISVLQATPVTWRMLLDAGFESSDQLKMLCGGEAWTRELADRLLSGGGRLWNMYGPTETTIWSSVNEVAKDDAPILIGPPLANSQFYVLDRNLQQVPAGSTGELFIGGDGVARGYHRQTEQTRERFLPDPFHPAPGARIYRTGDLVRLRTDGRMQYLGRTDQQIKLRGFRIEIEEVERAIVGLGGVDQATVQLKADSAGDQRLIAYLVAKDRGGLSSNDLRQALLQTLPDYMVPSHFQLIDKLPLTSNYKIDRNALPDPDWFTVIRRKEKVAPETATQRQMAMICQDVLGIQEVGIDESLIDLGADSLKMFQIKARANQHQLRVTMKQLIRLRTIASICEDIDKTAASAGCVHTPAPLTRGPRDMYRINAHRGQDAGMTMKHPAL
jgi:acyl-coenzyme A synthetase/AMP-(fatty) acid ligase/aryl carrier-like protein